MTFNDGGSTWTTQTSGTTNDLLKVEFVSTTVGWAVGGNGLLLTYENAALPVELTYFNGFLTGEGSLLVWQTASEQNNKGFEIERSKNGENWETIDFVDGNGTQYGLSDYSFVDENPFLGINYYRLKQVDFDGQYEYSNVVSIDFENTTSRFSTFPNPVKDKLNIINGQGIATIYNMLGQPVKQFYINNEQQRIDVSDLAGGQYVLQIAKQNGNTITQRFLK